MPHARNVRFLALLVRYTLLYRDRNVWDLRTMGQGGGLCTHDSGKSVVIAQECNFIRSIPTTERAKVSMAIIDPLVVMGADHQPF